MIGWLLIDLGMMVLPPALESTITERGPALEMTI